METGPGSLTAPRPNPDLVTVPLTAHPPVHPPLRAGLPLGAGSRPLTRSPRSNPQAASLREGLGAWRGQGGGPAFAEHLLCADPLRRTLYRAGS